MVHLNRADTAHVVHGRQADGAPAGPGAAGAADAVHMHFGVGCDVDVDHGFELRNIQPARGHVGSHQH